MRISIRLAVRDDAAQLPDIERSAGEIFRNQPGLGWIADDDVMAVDAHLTLIERGSCWVDEDAVAGLVGFISCERCGADMHIWEVSVRGESQGQKIGQRLIAAAIDRARQCGCVAVTLTTFRNVPWNAPYYAQMGFAMLPDAAIDPRLRAILNDEIAHGLAGDQRCAMRMPLLSPHVGN